MAFRGRLWYKMHELSHQMPISNLLNDVNNMFWLQPHGNFMNTSFTADQLSPQCPLYIYFVTNQMCKTLSGWFVGVLFLFCSCGVVLLLVLLCLALFTFVYGIEFIVLCPHSKNKRNLDLLVVVCVVSPRAFWRKKRKFLQSKPSFVIPVSPEWVMSWIPPHPITYFTSQPSSRPIKHQFNILLCMWRVPFEAAGFLTDFHSLGVKWDKQPSQK